MLQSSDALEAKNSHKQAASSNAPEYSEYDPEYDRELLNEIGKMTGNSALMKAPRPRSAKLKPRSKKKLLPKTNPYSNGNGQRSKPTGKKRSTLPKIGAL